MTYAFYFDSSSCTGCKACQAACKDKNNLPVGVLWRRVYEVGGGEWEKSGNAWNSTVFSYNLSIACNHCVHPKCAGVCPVDAYEVRPDGIVLINSQKCIGCGYCAWACPYDAPQTDKSAGVMTKCNLCYDNLDEGLPPACVSACPMRCLDIVNIKDPMVDEMGQVLWKIPGEEHPFPLPVLSRTEPHLIIKPHPGVKFIDKKSKVNNREETTPFQPKITAREEIPLLIFTLLAQMSIGAFGAVFFIIFGSNNNLSGWRMTETPFFMVGVICMFAMIASFFHLKTPKKAWRALSHLRKSWLSREILFTLGFTVLWATQAFLKISQITVSAFEPILSLMTFICGMTAVYCMQRVYQLRSKPAWNTNRTLIEFSLSTIGLGCWLTGMLLPQDTPPTIMIRIALIGVLAISASLIIARPNLGLENQTLHKARSGLLFVGLGGGIVLILWPTVIWTMGAIAVFMVSLAEEILGRWEFYLRRNYGI
jgi:anaerobic dimethyl sulfoxide reductase subunit B (iron-sulfur subunit)